MHYRATAAAVVIKVVLRTPPNAHHHDHQVSAAMSACTAPLYGVYIQIHNDAHHVWQRYAHPATLIIMLAVFSVVADTYCDCQ